MQVPCSFSFADNSSAALVLILYNEVIIGIGWFFYLFLEKWLHSIGLAVSSKCSSINFKW